jgi:hypothetical protein
VDDANEEDIDEERLDEVVDKMGYVVKTDVTLLVSVLSMPELE